MCLIITGQAQKVRETLLTTKDLLLDVFKTNPDGIGIMYAVKGKLKIIKKLPKSLEEAASFIERMPCDERLVAIHFRWTTHGNTNLENCHPYIVGDGVAMMHNGVLRTGNDADKTKSDTWHFIEDYLKEPVKQAPTLPFIPGFAALVKDFVGSSNKLVFMNSEGLQMIINKAQGLEHDGMWFSNTYAWTPRLLISDYKGYSGTYHGARSYTGYGGYGDGDWDDEVGYDWQTGRHGSRVYNGYGGSQQTGGNKSGVQHNVIALPNGQQSGRGAQTPAASPAAPATTGITAGGSTFTPEDEAIEKDWNATVRQAHTEWVRDQRASRGSLASLREGKAPAEQGDPPEEGQRAEPQGEVVAVNAPRKAELVEALTNADIDMFDAWLSGYPMVTLNMLFHLFKAAPTKWTTRTELAAYERAIYDAMIRADAADKTFLIKECQKEDGSAVAISEVICYYLNWYAWPGTTTEVAAESGGVEAPQYGIPSGGPSSSSADDTTSPKDCAHVESGAQLAQGGESDSLDTGSDNSVYVG